MTLATGFRRTGRAVLTVLALLCLLAIAVLVREVVKELKFLSSASSDNVHWTLSQAEVEFLEFRNAVNWARTAPETPLSSVIVEFDVFYSRTSTLANGSLYSSLREDPAFDAPLTEVRDRLNAMIPLIDGPRDELRANLDDLAAQADEMRVLVRKIATTGLQHFALESDELRTSVAVTLLRLAVLTGLLLLALAALLMHARRTAQQTEKRGKELAIAYARLNTILNTSLDAVVVTDTTGRIQNFNPAAERIFDCRLKDVRGKRVGDIIVPEHLRDAHEAGMARFAADGEHRVIGQGRVKLEAMRSNGETFPVEVAIETAHAGDEQLMVAFLRDISHRLAAENELVQARDKALAGEQAKAEFLAMMTHEIRTPLNGILGNLSLMEDTKLSSDQSRYMRNMKISGELLMRHVDAVLDVARFESGADKAQEDVTHLGHLFQDIVDSQTSAAHAHGNALQWGWVGTPEEWVEVDSSRLQQILLNLVGNAIKFTREGRISIEAEVIEQGEPAKIEIRVSDTGSGIAEGDLARIFEDFQTVSHQVSDSVGGTGLGLGIVRRFVQAMDGVIGVESTLGEGSTFWLRIPVLPVERPVEDSGAGPESEAPSDLEILLVEDNDINMQLAYEVLVGMGHHVTEARNGQEAVDITAKRPFDLILMDIRMPVMDGLTATKMIREGDGPNWNAPIVAFSANVLPEAKDRFAAAGMSDFLGKPLQRTELAQIIVRFCAGRDRRVKLDGATPLLVEQKESPMEKLRNRYMSETSSLFEWLAGLPEDTHAIADRAHQIAGSAAAFGQPGVREALLLVEQAAEAGDREDLVVAISEAQAAWKAAPEPSLVG